MRKFSLLALLALLTGCANDARLGKQADGRYLVATGQSLEPVGDLITFPGRPVDMCFSRDGKFVFVKDNQGLTIIDRTEAKVVERLKSGGTSGAGIVALSNGEVWLGDAKSTLHCAAVVDGKWGWKRKIELPKAKVGGEAYPCGIAAQTSRLWVCASRSNLLLCVDLQTGTVTKQIPVDIAPFDLVLDAEGERAYVSCWGGRAPSAGQKTGPSSGTSVRIDERDVAKSASVVKVDLESGEIVARSEVDLQPMRLALTPTGSNLYVAHGNADAVTVLDPASMRKKSTISTRLNADLPFGAMPNSIALSTDGMTLFAANGGMNCVAALSLTGQAAAFIPAGWYPGSLLTDGHYLWIANVKGVGTREQRADGNFSVYDTTGLVQRVELPPNGIPADWSNTAREGANVGLALAAIERGNSKAKMPVPEKLGEPSPIEHVVYILKENRTYDQVFGDVERAEGEPKLCIYGREITPNHHALADQFVLLDNFYCNGVNSADGHSWAMEGAVTGYLEKSFGGFTRSYPYGGDDAINAANSGFIWDVVLERGLSFRNFGEYDSASPEPKRTWAELYAESRAGKITTKFKKDMPHSRLRTYSDGDYPGWNMAIPEQVRADIFLQKFAAMRAMPNFTIIYLPQDHTNGTGVGSTTPRAHLADNDLALGRIVEALSKSKWWRKMAIFVMEDDPQNGFDHIDGHRSPALVVSPYVKRGALVSNFYNQTSMLHTMLRILGCRPLTHFMAQSPLMDACFTEKPDLTAYTCLKNNIPLDEMNKPRTPEEFHFAALSKKQDLSRPDAIEDDTMNRILWFAAKGSEPYPKEWSGAHGKGLAKRGLVFEDFGEAD